MSTKKKSRDELQLLRDEALDAYLNRDDFQYDVNGDALYRQYKDRYVELGKNAMQDTMGQAAALTGGYGSSYAQNVGQQAYQGYLQQLGDVVPELYQLAYDRYQDKGDQLYKTYQSWAQLEQEAAEQEQWAAEQAAQQEQWAAEQAAQQEQWAAEHEAKQAQWEKEYAMEEQKRQDANNQFQQELDFQREKTIAQSQGQNKTGTKTETTQPQSDYYAWLSYLQGKGERAYYNDPTVVTKYDNQNVSTGNIMTMQRALGLPETGMWTAQDQKSAGSMEADAAWNAYQKGQLQNRNSIGLGDQGLANVNVKAMERALGLKEDGYWSAADIKAAGGLKESEAWENYRKGLLQLRR